jgi:hypothetical protein
MTADNNQHDPICPICSLCGEREPDYTPQQVAMMHQISPDTAMRWFRDVLGVLTVGNGERLHKRSKKTMRIPQCVYRRWREEHSNLSRN